MSGSIDWDVLQARATEVRARAYAPYSEFTVGAALLSSGVVFVGANVENASYGLCLCAERSAIAGAVAAGHREFQAMAIAAQGPRPVPPCGMCRQVLLEFAPDIPVRCFTPEGVVLEVTVRDLLPHGFTPEHLA